MRGVEEIGRLLGGAHVIGYTAVLQDDRFDCHGEWISLRFLLLRLITRESVDQELEIEGGGIRLLVDMGDEVIQFHLFDFQVINIQEGMHVDVRLDSIREEQRVPLLVLHVESFHEEAVEEVEANITEGEFRVGPLPQPVFSV